MNRDLAEQIFPLATINRTSAVAVKSSTHMSGDIRTRLDSIYVVFPKMVMGERNRHRCFSLSDRSSRAVPPEKLIAEVRSGEGLAMPAKFRKRVKGMGGGDELMGDELIEAQLDWIEDALNAADGAERAMKREAKETVNRRLDMFIYMHSLQTGVQSGWLNFFGLRLDQGADPTIQVLAQKCFEAYRTTIPNALSPGSWHLPFIDIHEAATTDILINLSAARCAHLSYNDLETGQRMTLERALGIAAKLKDTSPLHASPFEHQATPDTQIDINGIRAGWKNRGEHGNLPGWRQARKMIPDEQIAPLPEGYEL
jgi:thymidylate synthase ThyX